MKFEQYCSGKLTIGEANENRLSENTVEISISPEAVDGAEFVELTLNEQPIPAGSTGWYLVTNGTKCNDFAIGSYVPREDETFIQSRLRMPVLAFSAGDEAKVVIATGMQWDIAQVVEIKAGVYTHKLRFELYGHTPYEALSLRLITMPAGMTYSEAAREYRNFQLASGFKTIRERLNPELQYSVEAPNVRVRMGWKPVPCEILEQTPENEPPVHVACTFDDVIHLMESYRANGIEKAEFCLVGWNMRGHDGRWPQILPVEESLGGEEGLRRLIKRAKELGYAMTCHTNSTDAYRIAETFDENDLARKRDGSISIEANTWGGGRTYNICPKRAYEISMQTLPEVATLGFRGMHYIDVITCTPASECFHPEHPVNKRESQMWFDKLFEDAKGMFGSVGCEGPYDQAMKHCDYTLYVSFQDHMIPLACPLADRAVPFWQLVYHGIVPSNPYSKTVNDAIGDAPDYRLKVIEFGGKPQIYYYGHFKSDGKNWIGKSDFHCNTPEEIAFSTEKVKETVDIYNEMAYLQYEFMESHEEIAPNVFRTTYSDGSYTTVDYNNKTWELTKA